MHVQLPNRRYKAGPSPYALFVANAQENKFIVEENEIIAPPLPEVLLDRYALFPDNVHPYIERVVAEPVK